MHTIHGHNYRAGLRLAWLIVCAGIATVLPALGRREPHEIVVATVQFEVSEELYTSPATFEAAVERIVDRATAHHGADLVVFPEYLNVFLIASRYPSALRQSATLEEALDAALAQSGALSVHELFTREAAWVLKTGLELWSGLAREYGVAIVAGTFFAPVPTDGEIELRNRALVVDRDGRIVHQHDKAFLTEVELEILDLDPGSPDEAEPFEIDGLVVGLTVCRDTFFEEWHEPYAEVDLWIDLRANGEPYSRDVYLEFLKTLPERVREADATAGVNASLTGSLLDLVWEGPSYVVDGNGTRIAASRSPVGTEITSVRLVRTDEGWEIAAP